LEEFIDTPVKRYSSGMYARLGFSVAAHIDPEVLIVDEVLSVGDYVFQQKCVERMHSVINDGTTVLFVSHNLKAVTELCERAMWLERGKVVTIGPTDDVIRCYLSDALKSRSGDIDKVVSIAQVRVRDRSGEQSTFESGETAWVDIEVTAHETAEKLAVVIWLTDQSQYLIFDTSTQRLGHRPFELRPGESYRCTFELKLNIAHGTFHVCAAIYRYDIQKEYDSKAPAATVFIGSTMAVRGAVNCFPKLVAAETMAATSVEAVCKHVESSAATVRLQA
jgi:energy-coupling factor transporter ATP-binding protein EcfA2